MEAETKPSGLIGEGDNPFVEAIEKAYGVPYLGDAADVGALLRNLIADSVTRWTSGKDASDAEKLEADSEDIDEVVSVLLGKDPDFAPVPVWNAPGHIDLWIKKQVPSIADKSPEDVVESAVRLFLLECWTVIDDWNQPGSNEADCQNAITLVIDQWVSVFLGIDAAALNEMESELKSAEDLGNEIGAALTEGSVRKSLAEVWDEEDERKHPRGEDGRWSGKGGGSSGGKGPKKNPKYDDGDAGESYSPPDDDEWLASPKKPSYQSSFGFGSKHGGGYVPKGKTAEEREADDLPDDPTIKELAKKYPKLGELFSGTSGTEAGSVEQHTKVMKNRFRQQMPEAELAGLDERWGGNLKKVLDVALSLHDIGKPLAVKAGDKSRQHEFSSPVILETMKAEGFTDREINLTEALVGHDILGEAVKALNERPVAGKKFEPHDVDVASEIVAAAKLADMSPQDFAKLQLAFYHADAGSYGYVRNSFMKQDESGRLSLKSKVAIQDAIDIAEGKPISPPMVSFSNKTTADQFIAARNATSRPGFLSPLVPEDLKSHSLFVSNDGKVGVAVSKDGDIQNVFNNGGPKGGGVDAVLQAIRNGGKTLDCFDGYLPGLYAQLGFVETGRMKFNREYAPEGWDFEKYGEPDVVFMGLPKGGLSREQELEFRRRAKGDKSAWVAPAKSDAYYDDWDKAKSDSRGAGGSGDGKKDEGRGSDAPAGGAGAGASSGVRRPVDSKPSPSQKKTPVVRDYTDETMKGVWGSDDPYVYHASPLSIDVVKFQEGLKPSKSGHGGAGVYFATDPEATYWHADKGKSRLFRVNKAALVNKFGKFPEDFDGVEHDELDGEVIVGGSRRIPADMLEVQVDGEWMSVRDAAKAAKAAKKKSLGLERYSLAALMKTFDESKVVRNRGRFAPKGSARVAGEKKPKAAAFGELVRASFPKLPKGADVIAQFGETLPLDEAEQVFVAAGLDELTAADLVADLRERGDRDSVSSKTVAVIARSQLYKADEAGRRSAVVDAVGGDRVAMFEVPDERQTKFIVHPSTRSPGKWQLSRMDKDGPVGHSEFDSQDEALASAVAAHPKGHMFNDGDSDAVLTTSVASNGVTRSHGGAKKKSLSSVLDDVSRFVGFDVEMDRYRLRCKTFDESKHRRGQPGNAGQFAPKGSAGAVAKKPKETKPKAAKAAPAASSSTPLSSEALTAAIGAVKLRERRHVTVEYADGSVFAGAPLSRSPDNSLIMFGGKWKSGPKAGESMVLAVKARDKDVVSLGYKTDPKPKKEKTAAPAKAAEVEAAKPAAPAPVPASQETKPASEPSSSEPAPPPEPTAEEPAAKKRPQWGVENVEVSFSGNDKTEQLETRKKVREHFGGEVVNNLASLGGNLPGAKVMVSTRQSGRWFMVDLRSSHPDYKSIRRLMINVDTKEKYVSNDNFEAKKTGTGIGTQMLASQVESASRLGFDHLWTLAAGGGEKYGPDDDGYNGYYTWARLGYDATFEELASLKIEERTHVDKHFPEAKSISDLMKTKEGRKWWKENGVAFTAKFKLSPDSLSMKVLHEYASAKADATGSKELRAIADAIGRRRGVAGSDLGSGGEKSEPKPEPVKQNAGENVKTSPPSSVSKEVAALKPTQIALDQIKPAQEKNLAAFAKATGRDPEEIKRDWSQAMKSAVERADVFIAVPPNVLGKVLEDGRYKSQLETKYSASEDYQPEARTESEYYLMGIPQDTPPEQRPVYGYLSSEDPRVPDKSRPQNNHDTCHSYGSATLKLKPSVKSRVTFCGGDSLNEQEFVLPSPMLAPDLRSINHLHFGYGDGVEAGKEPPLVEHRSVDGTGRIGEYTEAQIHGGLPISEIERVYFTKEPPPNVAAKLKQLGIPYELKRST